MAEHTIAQNPSGGVLGFITNHGYLDNPTFRGMRWHLLETFDKIWVLDLHGNAKKLAVGPDGNADKNVFDIQQGVAIVIAVRKGGGNIRQSAVWRGDIWGTRENKNSNLWVLRQTDTQFKPVDLRGPFFGFTLGDGVGKGSYDGGFALKDLLDTGTMGVQTSRDNLAIDFSRQAQTDKMRRFLDASKSDLEVRTEFFGRKKAEKYLAGDSRGWRLSVARDILRKAGPEAGLQQILYRPFRRTMDNVFY